MKVLIALDDSDCSKHVLEFVAERPWSKEDEFLIISVVQSLPEDVGLGHYPPDTSSYEENEQHLCNEVVSKAAELLRGKLPNNKIETTVPIGSIVARICDCASVSDSDLLILGSHGRKGIQHFLLGSVAEEIVRSAPCSIQIIKEKKAISEEKRNSTQAAGKV